MQYDAELDTYTLLMVVREDCLHEITFNTEDDGLVAMVVIIGPHTHGEKTTVLLHGLCTSNDLKFEYIS